MVFLDEPTLNCGSIWGNEASEVVEVISTLEEAIPMRTRSRSKMTRLRASMVEALSTVG